MSMDRSLKMGTGLARHRNVLSRAERIERLVGRGKFDLAAGDPLNLPKVGNRKVVTGGKDKKKEGDAAAAGATPAAGAAAAAPAAKGGKAAAAPAAKAAAPAAKGGKK